MIEREKIKEILICDLGIGNLSPQDQDEVVTSLGESILKNIMMKVMESLPEAALAEFEVLTKSGDSEKLQVFLSGRIPQLEELVQETIQGSIGRYKELAGIK